MGVRKVGRWLIYGGAMVWVVFAIVWLAGGEPTVDRFLPFHLIGVIPGAILSRWRVREDRAGS